MPVATGPVRAPHNPHNHVQFIARALQAQVRNGEVETIAHLDSVRRMGLGSAAPRLSSAPCAAAYCRLSNLLSPPAKGDNKATIAATVLKAASPGKFIPKPSC